MPIFCAFVKLQLFQQHAADNIFFIHFYETQIQLLLMHHQTANPATYFSTSLADWPLRNVFVPFLPRRFSTGAKENFVLLLALQTSTNEKEECIYLGRCTSKKDPPRLHKITFSCFRFRRRLKLLYKIISKPETCVTR